MTTLNRRKFIKTVGAGTALAATAAPTITLGADIYGDNILIFVFQRGGIDGLSFMAPMDGHPDRGHYEGLRTNGTQIPSASLLPTASGWGLHPAAGPLIDLWNDNSLAVVQAVGLPWANRSHFEAERYVELGTPGNRFTTTGWLTRHLQTAGNLPESLPLPAVVTESTIRLSLLGEPSAVAMRYPTSFQLDTSNYETEQEDALVDIYALDNLELNVAGSQALNAMQLIKAIDWNNYVPSNGAVYPVRFNDPGVLTNFGHEMKTMAQLIKEDTGLRIGETDFGGWDTHNGQGNLTPGDWFYDQVRDMSEGIKAFFTDLDVPSPNGKTWAERTTMLVYSEFGRRAFDNADAGTDHGWGNNCLVVGGGVNGGQLYGTFLGLHEDFLFQGADVWATTDYRTVFSEILLKRLHQFRINQIFPGFEQADYEAQETGVVSGSLHDPYFGDPEILLKHGME
ncbi:MAG: DUF1501 domain-containing protein [Xanthomonadales bacterium]|nr:DUF1501 domain-containing protein [Xanthomonadales bacterium]